MKKVVPILVLVAATLLPSLGHANCYADYKAKKEDPLRLHYGVVQVETSSCRMSNAVRRSVEDRVRAGGWILLQVESVFDDSGLNAKRRDAGEFFLRY